MRNNTLVFPIISKYDVFQLKKDYAKNFSLGMTAAVLIHILLIGTYIFVQSVTKSVESKTKYIIVDFGPPPPINIPANPVTSVSSPGSFVKNGIPIPVPDDIAAVDNLIPSQDELSRGLTQPGDLSGNIVKTIPPNMNAEIPKDEIPVIGEFTPYEKAPEIIESVMPEYPELARRANLEGTVYVKVLIGKNGKPLKAVAVKFDSEIFVKPSIDAAMKSVFTPAIQHKAPVMVWITVPFKFRLNNQN